MPTITRRQLLSLAAVPATTAFVPTACKSSRDVVEAGFVRIGGIEQWIGIRGRDRSRPAILFLHGGPGGAQSPFLSRFALWEERYTVANWDQRGAGKTFGRNKTSTSDMTLERIAQDAIEVTEHVLQRLHSGKLILVGHSWGAILGLSVIRLRPDLFHAFVGTGQPVSWRESFEWMRSAVLSQANAEGNTLAIGELSTLGSSQPYDTDQLKVLAKWRQIYMPAADREYFNAKRIFLGSRNASASNEAADWIGGDAFSIQKLLPTILNFDAKEIGNELPIPFFVIHGRNDATAPPEAARKFVEQLRAPRKGFTLIEGGHFACFTNPSAFLNTLARDIG